MKYHTTLSTIIISLIVLLCFALAVVFCVTSLGITSPGYLIVDQILTRIDNTTDFSVSFSSIERNMSSRITVNDIELCYMDNTVIQLDELTVYQNPFQIAKYFFTKSGRIEIDIEGLSVNLESLDQGGEKSQQPVSLVEVNEMIQSVESYDYLVRDMAFYQLAYSVNIENFTLRLGQHLNFSGLRMNLLLDEGLSLNRFVFNAPEISLQLADAGINAEDLSLIFSKDEEGYSTRFSVQSAQARYNDLNINSSSLALTLDFENFSSLDIFHLPLRLSAGQTDIRYNDYSLSADYISFAATGNNGADAVILDAELESAFADVSTFRINTHLSRNEEKTSVTISTPSGLFVQSQEYGFDAYLRSLSADIRIENGITFTILGDSLEASGLDEITSGFYSGLTGSTLTISGQLNESSFYADISSRLEAESEYEFFDGTSLDFNVSCLMEKGNMPDIIADIRSLSFEPLDEAISGRVRYFDGGLEGNVRLGDRLSVSMTNGELKTASINITSLKLEDFMPLVREFAPSLDAYIDDSTRLNGTLNLDYSSADGLEGNMLGSLAFENIQFNQYHFNMASTLSASFDPENVSISYFTLTTQWIRVSYGGDISLETFFPQGNLSIEFTESGEKLLNFDFFLDSENEYYVDASIPRFPNSYLRGSVNWAREKVITSSGELRSGNTIYPFDFVFDMNESLARLTSSGLEINAGFEDVFDLGISFNSFTLPMILDAGQEPTSLDGTFDFRFDFAGQTYTGHSDDFIIHSMSLIPSNPDVSFDLYLDNSELRLDNIYLRDEFTPYSGRLVFQFENMNLAFTLGNHEERINLSLLLHSGDYSGLLSLENVSLDRYSFRNTALTTTLIGRGESGNDFAFSGTVLVESTDENESTYALSADVVIDERGFESQNLNFATDNLDLRADNISFDASEGLFTLDAYMHFVKVNKDRAYPVSAAASVEVSLDGAGSILETLSDTISNLEDKTFTVSATLDYLDIDNGYIRLEDKMIDALVTSQHADFYGNFIAGTLVFDTMSFDITIFNNEILHGHASGHFSADDINIQLDDINFNLASINWLYPSPLVTFDNPAWVYGDFILYGSIDDSHLYGQGGTHGFDMRVWWVKDAYLHLGDTEVTVVDNHASTSMTPVVVVDEDDGDLHRGFAVAQAQLSNADILEYYDIEVWVPEGETIFIHAPVYSQGIQIKADVSGHFKLTSDLKKNNLSGELDLYNAVLSIGIDDIPEWWGPSRFEVRNEYDVTLRENCSFVMPLGPNPILQAYFDEDCSFHFLYDSVSRERAFNGTLSFRSGEIYYFQKNFFITEGSIIFPSSGSDMSNARLNLRARLRDYNSEGEKVDIYLVLNNSSLSSFNPTFESTPQMNIEEIMQILGSSILPSSAYNGTNLASFASILTSGMDVLNRMGVINTTGYSDLSAAIREGLGVDIFSLKTNILQNFIIDTIFSSSYNLSPLATYLNNTSIYIGKYMTKSLYLQIMFYLQAVEKGRNENSFLSNDLSLDLEISLEWENPLGTITFFTTPQNMTLYSIMDNFGISYSKTLYF